MDTHYDGYMVGRGYPLRIVFVFDRHARCFFVGQPVDQLAEVRNSNRVVSRAVSVVPHFSRCQIRDKTGLCDTGAPNQGRT
jgi:hypothetical protein